MKKIIIPLLAVLLWNAPSFAQTRVASGSLTAASASCLSTNCAQLALQPTVGAVSIQITGTFSATVQFEGTAVASNGTYVALTATPVAGGAGVSSATATGLWIIPAAGLVSVRARVSAFTSGPVVVTVTSSDGIPAGTTAGASSSISGTLTTNAATSSTNNLGVLPAIANAAAPSYTETYLAHLSMDLKGRIRSMLCDGAGNDRCAYVSSAGALSTAPIPSTYNATQPTYSDTNSVAQYEVSSRGELKVVQGVSGFTADVAGLIDTTEPAAGSDAAQKRLFVDSIGRTVTSPFAASGLWWSSTPTAVNGTTEQDIKTADATYKYCITWYIVGNTDATTGELLVILDNGAIGTGTALLSIPAAPAYGGAVQTLNTPVCTSAVNHKITADSAGSANSVTVTVGGFKTIP